MAQMVRRRFLTLPHEPTPLPDQAGISGRRHLFEQEVIDALNAALATCRPLLVRGEPGTGKTQLAEAAAIELDRPLLSTVVDSRTESRDLMYTYDAVARLGEAQLCAAMKSDDREQIDERLAVKRFVHPGPLWWAFHWKKAQEQADWVKDKTPAFPKGWDPEANAGCVVLLDEIDKAETDVPNGLLEALGAGKFRPPGVVEDVAVAGVPPLVIITTNEERALPDPFVRRCVVLWLELPAESQALQSWLVERGRAHLDTSRATQRVLERAAEIIAKDRSDAQDKRQTPLPGQAEYLDLVRAVVEQHPDDEASQFATLEKARLYVVQKHRGVRS
ncbi:MAG: MoxR family ATPase [Planctomycetota bacterium]|nr:MoxR family ATPase [Planctomycetota bacterium]